MTIELLNNINLLFVGITVVAIGTLGFLVYLNNKKSVTNKAFFLFSLLTIVWGISNYFNNQTNAPTITLWILRAHISIAVWHAFSFFQLAFVFPKNSISFPNKYKYALVPFVVFASFLNLTPLVFSGINKVSEIGQVSVIEPGPGIIVFIITAVGLIGSGLFLLFRKTIRASGTERNQYKFVLFGTVLTFALIIVFNIILPLFFENVRYIPLGAAFIFPFIASTAYAIIKYRFLNVRVIATQLFVFALWIALLFITFNGHTITDIVLHSVVLFATIILGIFLIRSVLQEVRTREKMAQLALDLEITNKELKLLDEAKSDFISIASHQLRTPLSIIKGYISMVKEGTYGKITKELEDPLHKVYVSNERLINLVSDLLDLSRMERGKMQYEFMPMRLGEVAEGIVMDFEKVAKDKGLKFSWNRPKGNDLVKGDANKLRQVILNLIDNAIKYTRAGSIDIAIEEIPGKVCFSVTDTGPGLTQEEVHALFQKFSRGREERSVHTEGLGLGLYVAKLIAEAHSGDLSVTSPGKGKGSTFSLTLPIYSESAENFKKFASAI